MPAWGTEMGVYLSEIWPFIAAGTLLGGTAAWLFCATAGRRQVRQLTDDWQSRIDDLARQRDRLNAETASLRTTIEAQQAVVRQHEKTVAATRTELESTSERIRALTKDVFTLRSEREDSKAKIATFQTALAKMKQQSLELQSEFVKSKEFYKRELAKAFEKRKALEIRIDNAKAEHESFSNLLQATRSEHESVNRMLASARARLASLDELERQVIQLEAENAQLKHDASSTRLQIETLERDVAELEELKTQNRELARCLESMENSRRQYEADARRYREQAGHSEKESETLRLRLDDVEKTFADMERQQREALQEVKQASISTKTNGKTRPVEERDDLQEIVGIGKVFERTLHDLGIYSFRQIAAFDVTDIARVNAALKECKGRMEQDDWIGQAKELLYQKYNDQ